MDLYLPPKPAIILPRPKEILKKPEKGIYGAPVGFFGSQPPSVSYAAANINTTNPSNTFTWNGTSISTADPTRYMYLIAYSVSANIASDTDWVSSCSIAGVSATKIFAPGSSSNSAFTMWRAAVPTGTSGTVSLTRNTGNGFSHVMWALFAVYNLLSTTPVHTITPSGSTSASGTLNLTAGGVAFGMAIQITNNGFTWSGLTETFDTQGGVGGNSYGWTGALKNNVTGSSMSVGITSSGFIFSLATSLT